MSVHSRIRAVGSDRGVSSRFKVQRVLAMKVYALFPDRARPFRGQHAIYEYR
jgi:hypothetical protein